VPSPLALRGEGWWSIRLVVCVRLVLVLELVDERTATPQLEEIEYEYEFEFEDETKSCTLMTRVDV
jgi:hypothetical protein